MTDPGLTPARFRLVREHFEAALDATPADLEQWLTTAIPDDLPLRNEVRTLLRAHRDESGTLASPFNSTGMLDVGAADRSGDRVGAWTVVRQIGAGGMGTVYEAHRAEGEFEQRAAMKFLRRSVEGDVAIRRFRAERQILANLHHPNIAALLDGGVAPGGQPYFAMEFVDGKPITTWCDERSLDLRSRLVLFLQVCAAVQHAHQALVVHRDLKPGNILVTEQGTVKLLDFGIATLLRDDEDPDHLPLTQGNARLFTPDYAAPEQVRGQRVGTTADVYALGVVLFELLTGRRPLQLRGKSIAEIEEAVCHEAPPRPSTALEHQHWQHLGAGSARQASHRIAGDLDAIVLAALRKEPERRYGSADQLARDLRAFLDGMPVTARPDGMGYRLGKFVRRRRIELAAGGVAVAALVGGIVVSRARAQEAERERTRAVEITAFLTNMLIAANPSELGREVTMREVMDSAAVRADALRDRPALEIEIRTVIAGTYLGLGSYDEALAEYQKALDAARRSEPVPGRATALALSQLSTGHEYLGDYGTADSLFAEAQQLMDRAGYRDRGEEREWMEHRGRLLGRLGKFAESIPLLRRALALHLEVEPENDSATAYYTNNLAVAVGEVGDQAEADTLFRTTLALERKAVGELHPLYAASLSAYSTVLHRMGRIEAADTAMRSVLDIRRQLLGEDHPDYAWTMFNYADFLVGMDRHAEAAEWSRKVLALRGRTLDDAHPAVSTAMQVLGRAMAGLDSLEQAERLLRESLALRQEHFPPGHWVIASSVSHLGVVIGRAGRYAEAEKLLLDSEAELLEKRGAKAQPVRDARQRLVDLYLAWGRPQQAAAWQEKLDAPTP